MNKTTFIFFKVFIALLLVSCSGDSEHERILFDKIKHGMHVNKVVEILGKPDTIVHGLNSTSSEFIFFSKNKSGLRSQMPVVIFDSSMKVTASTYGE